MAQPRMLLIEDDEVLREYITKQFTAHGYIVDEAADGIVGLELNRKLVYNVILLDLTLPKMDGLLVMQQMKKENRLPPTIILTALTEFTKAIECLKLGAKDYISKPYDQNELLQVVTQTVNAYEVPSV